MSSFLILAPFFGAGIGLAAAYGITQKDRRIHFVERDNLNEEVEDLDIEIKSSETCVECGDEVNPENVGALVRDNGEYRVVCDKAKCLDTYDIE
jgi:hypothetical protein